MPGLPRYSLRVRNNDFDAANLAAGIAAVHAQGRRLYLACNLMPHGAKLRTFVADLDPIVALGPDALILADPGLILLARERWPEVPIHLSVQANTLNAAAVRFWQAQGHRPGDPVARAVPGRDRRDPPGLSGHRTGGLRPRRPLHRLLRALPAVGLVQSSRRQPGQLHQRLPLGIPVCAEPSVRDRRRARHPAADEVYLLEEGERPGQFMPIFEDEHGTYIMNARDLRAVEHVGRLVAMGIDCLKIEGRTKSHYYAARTAQVYRAGHRRRPGGRPFRPELLADLEGLANRGYTEGFYRRHAPAELQNYERGASDNERQIFVGEVARSATDGWAEVEVKNRFGLGDELELLTPAGNHRFRLAAMTDLEGQPMDLAPGSGYRVRIPLPVADGHLGLVTRIL